MDALMGLSIAFLLRLMGSRAGNLVLGPLENPSAKLGSQDPPLLRS